MGRLVLIRHGESEANRDRCFASSGDVPLTDLGRLQALELAHRIDGWFHPELVLSSEFLRARETAAIIANRLGLAVETFPGLHERDFGCLKGLPYERLREMTAADPNFDPERDWTWAPQGGETRDAVRLRVMTALEQLRTRYPESDVLVVSHGAAMAAVWAHLTGTWTGANVTHNCGIILLEHSAAGFALPVRLDDLLQENGRP